jgi:hypothetical protein
MMSLIIRKFGEVRESEKSHRLFEVGEEFGVLGAARCEFVRGKFESRLELFRPDQLDKPEEMQMEQEWRVGIEDLHVS